MPCLSSSEPYSPSEVFSFPRLVSCIQLFFIGQSVVVHHENISISLLAFHKIDSIELIGIKPTFLDEADAIEKKNTY